MQISQQSTWVGVFFNKVAGPQNCNFIKKETPVKFAKFLRTSYFTEHLQRLLLAVSGFQPATLLKRVRQRSVNFAKFVGTSFDRTPPDGCFLSTQEAFIRSCFLNLVNLANLWIFESVNFEKCFRSPVLWNTSGKLFISCAN